MADFNGKILLLFRGMWRYRSQIVDMTHHKVIALPQKNFLIVGDQEL